MIADFLQTATINILIGFGNTLLNGFASNVSARDKTYQISLQFSHFIPINEWSLQSYNIVDKTTENNYSNDSKRTLRLKCAALIVPSLLVQPVGLTLNVINRTVKIMTVAHLWNPSKEKYNLKARIFEWIKDVAVVLATPLIYIALVVSAMYGATLRPYDGRKLYSSFERLAYSGGYQHLELYGWVGQNLHLCLLAPCFQPDPKAHLGGRNIEESNVW